MKKRLTHLIVFSLLLVAVSATSVFSAKKAWETPRYNPVIRQLWDYAFPMEDYTGGSTAPKFGDFPQASLGASVPSSSPGAVIGNTYYGYQANQTMRRHTMIGRNFDTGLGDTLTLIHFLWMDLPGPDLGNARTFGYAAYSAADVAYLTEVNGTFAPEYCGYFELEVSADNKAVVVGHWRPGPGINYAITAFYDVVAPGDAGFGVKATVDTALSNWNNPYTGSGRAVIWPTIGFQNRPTGETVTHVAGVTSSPGLAHHAYYFRREGHADSSLGDGSLSSCFISGEIDPTVEGWDCPWVFDSVWSHTSVSLEASKKSGKVALYWTANLPEPGCDTCSINSTMGGTRDIFFNDIYYNISDDYGVTWNPRVNATKFDTLVDQWIAENDLAGLWVGDAPNEEFHLAWVALDIGHYLIDNEVHFTCRVYHWAESFPGAGFGPRVAMTSQNHPIVCNGGGNSNLSMISMATCAGNIYISAVDRWDGHDDPDNPDCSQRGYDGAVSNTVNGEIVVVISDNNGVSFDLPHNLTNSPTPQCDSATGAVGACDADHWASMAPFGITTLSGDDFSGADTVLPRAVAYPDGVGTEWLHMSYINDLDPGTAFLIDGSTWNNDPVRHFRIACVNPDQIPVPVYEYAEVNWPNYVKPGASKDTTLIIENTGNATLNITVTTEEITGPAGWLTVVPGTFDPVITDGANNADTGTIRFDASGITQAKINAAGGHIVVTGRVLFDHDGPSDIDTLNVILIVTDTVLLTNWDTISTGVISLAVATNGQYGGGNLFGPGVRMDYWFDPAECDTVDSIVGLTNVYLYDGSFAVGGIVGGDTIISNQIFDQGPRNFSSVYSVATDTIFPPMTDGMLQTWSTGKMTNHDTSLAFNVTYYAPQVTTTYGSSPNKTWHVDQQFITKCLKIWSNDGLDHLGLAIGDAIDWDIPSDQKDTAGGVVGTNVDNRGEVNDTLGLIYFIGAETGLDDATECQENDARFGGMAHAYTTHYNGATKKWSIVDTLPYGGYAEANARYVYTDWDDNELYVNMAFASGLIPWSHANPDSQETDLHGVLTYKFEYNLLAGDTLVVYTVLATVREDNSGPSRIEDLADKGRNFTHYFGCCRGLRGDLNNDNKDANVLDLTFSVDRIFRGGGPAVCSGEADANSDKSILDVLDLTFLVDRIFRGGPAPNSCGTPL